MEYSLTLNRPTQLLLSRGSGKSSLASALCLYATALAKKTYSVIISANAIASKSLLEGIWKCITEKGTAFAQDFPELVLPFQLCSGSYRRRQLYRGASTEIAKNASVIQFARLQDEHGKEIPTSRARIECRSTTGGLRGMLHLGMRPQLAICDDWQTTTSAANPEQVEKLVRTMNQDVFGLQGKEAIQILALQTPIFPEDFVERLAQDKAWKTIKYPCVIRWPRDIEEKGDTGLWAEYFRIYDRENANDESHDTSLAFYKENQAAMDEGAELFQPDRYKPEDGFISGL